MCHTHDVHRLVSRIRELEAENQRLRNRVHELEVRMRRVTRAVAKHERDVLLTSHSHTCTDCAWTKHAGNSPLSPPSPCPRRVHTRASHDAGWHATVRG